MNIPSHQPSQIESNTTSENLDVIKNCGFERDEDTVPGEEIWRSVDVGNGPVTAWAEVIDGVLYLFIGDEDGTAHGYIPAAGAVAMIVEGARNETKPPRWTLTN